uniref:SFRICE_012721 n=1 Tax=Spodoptera frugiperda TaxID=7108 RepID=A0A2H1VMZ9_SPOFR
MLLLLLLSLAPAALALYCPSDCYCVLYDELEYTCRAGDSSVKFNARNNEYVNIRCEPKKNLTCSDLPRINFANNQTLPSLWLRECPPSIIPCLNEALMTPSVGYVSLTQLQAPLRADDVEHLGDVQEIMITEGPKDPIPPSALQKLPSLRRLRIKTAVTLSPSIFAESPQLEYLELSDPQIVEIPSGTFTGLRKLKMLNFFSNDISDVEVDSLLGLDSLESLSFSRSRLVHIAPGALTHVPKLKYLDLIKNRIAEIPPGLLTNLTELENVTIHMNDVNLKLHSNSISNLPSLKQLIIKDCGAELPNDLIIGCEALITLDLSQNRITGIPENFFKDLKNIEHLDLSFNKIAKLTSGVLSPMKQLKYLNLDRNHLEVLPEFLFAGLRKLENVSINENLLTSIDSLAFQGATALHTISLYGNRLTLKSNEHIQDYMDLDLYSPFNTLSELKNLNLSKNNISSIFDDWRIVLLNLELLDLSYNHIGELLPDTCQFLSNKITVNLQHNDISTVILYPTSHMDLTDPSVPSNNVFLLDNNPFNCDCHIYNLAMRLQGKKLPYEPTFNLGKAQCKSPRHLRGDLLTNVSPLDLYCEEMSPDIRFNCSSVKMRPAYNDLAYDCDDVPPFFPDEIKNYSLKLRHPPKDLRNLTLSLLNLTGIGLQEIPFTPSESVKVIDLSNNNLTEIPIRFLESNTTLYLSNNPFICDCSSKDDILALRASFNVNDLDIVSCSNGDLVTDLEISGLCYTRTLIAEIGGILIFLLIILVFIITFIFPRQMVLYCGHRLFPCWYIDDPETTAKEYDIFISYAHKDQKYVNKLLPKLENDFKLKVCVHYRDWEVGDFIPDQINRSVSNSRKTIILLSNSFLDSTFANLEFRTAHNLALKEGRERVILILLEDVSKHEKLSEELKYHMKMNTYLTWDDIRFDEKLKRRTIPQKYNRKKFVAPAILKPIFRQATENNLKKALDVHLNSAGQLVNLAQNKKNIDMV